MKISKILLEWYKKNARELPWRKEKDPYRIWLSEIILQQTRVEQGKSYYYAFTADFPDIHSLAAASEQEVLKLWQGLGYYNRARNMLITARRIVGEFNGQFPGSYKELINLKGIGPYTAAAISSIAFNEAVAAVDGNVIRVISRLFAIEQPVNLGEGRRIIQQLAEELLDHDEPGTYNEAMMELGALTCTPRNPDCENCPLNHACMGLNEGQPARYPLKVRKQKLRDRWLNYFHIDSGNETIFRRRSENDIWQGLYDFPLLETGKEVAEDKLILEAMHYLHLDSGQSAKITLASKVRHQLSHQTLHIRFFRIEVDRISGPHPDGWIIADRESAGKLPVPVVISNYIYKVWDLRDEQ